MAKEYQERDNSETGTDVWNNAVQYNLTHIMKPMMDLRDHLRYVRFGARSPIEAMELPEEMIMKARALALQGALYNLRELIDNSKFLMRTKENQGYFKGCEDLLIVAETLVDKSFIIDKSSSGAEIYILDKKRFRRAEDSLHFISDKLKLILDKVNLIYGASDYMTPEEEKAFAIERLTTVA